MPDDLPLPIGPEVDFLVKKALILKQHADAVREAKDRAEQAIAEATRYEVHCLTQCGFNEGEALKIAAQESAHKRYEIRQELEALLAYHAERLQRRLQRLEEEFGDSSTERAG